MKKEQLILVGGGGHCLSCIDVIEAEGRFDIIGIVDKKENIGKTVLGYPIIGTDDDLPKLREKTTHFFITVGHIHSPEIRIRLYKRLKNLNATLPTIISPMSYVSKHTTIAEGTIVMHSAIINAGAIIGKNCIINTKALVEHGASVGSNSHISTGAIINGDVSVGTKSFVGSGTTTKQGITLPDESFIKAHSVIK